MSRAPFPPTPSHRPNITAAYNKGYAAGFAQLQAAPDFKWSQAEVDAWHMGNDDGTADRNIVEEETE